MIKTINYLFVTCFGIGSLRFAPGTITSLITTIFLYSLFHLINLSSNIIPLDRLTIWNRLYKKIVVTKEVIVPGANLKDPIPKHVTNK